MPKMDSSEANEIFLYCNDALKRLIRFNGELSSAIGAKQLPYSMNYYEERYETMKVIAKSGLERAAEAAENAGWWKRRIAITLMNDLITAFRFAEIGINQLRNKSKN